ncbi:MAG: hypothetical protein IRZ28_11205 [Steroidobacteraceae bacterium]|nr:hypothetical protein [Steroidobacteraceae bacterium]
MKLNAAELFDTLEVDLWGNAYTLRHTTRSVAAKLDEATKASAELGDDASDDDQVRALVRIIDVLLEPAEDTPSAEQLLMGLWRDDKLGMDWLLGFVDALTEEAANRRRPTSAGATRS